MAKQPTITTVTSGYYGRQALNTNFENIRDQFDNTLSRDGSTPNAMNADFDLNGNDLLNAKDGEFTNSLTVKGVDVLDALGGSVGAATVFKTTNRFTGDGSTVAFTLSKTPAARANTDVFINGIYQQKDTYTVSGTTLTFTEAPPAVGFEVVIYEAIDVGSVDASSVTTSDGQDVQAKFDQAAYPTRAAFVADVAAGKLWALGDIVKAGQVMFQYDGATTAISDLQGWATFIDTTPNHFADNTTPGTTDMAAATQAAIAYEETRAGSSGGYFSIAAPTVVFRSEVYYFSTSVTADSGTKDLNIVGNGALILTDYDGPLFDLGDANVFTADAAGTAATYGISVVGLKMKNTGTTNAASVGIRAGRCWNMLIRDCTFYDFWIDVDFHGVGHSIVEKNFFFCRERTVDKRASLRTQGVYASDNTKIDTTGIHWINNEVSGDPNNTTRQFTALDLKCFDGFYPDGVNHAQYCEHSVYINPQGSTDNYKNNRTFDYDESGAWYHDDPGGNQFVITGSVAYTGAGGRQNGLIGNIFTNQNSKYRGAGNVSNGFTVGVSDAGGYATQYGGITGISIRGHFDQHTGAAISVSGADSSKLECIGLEISGRFSRGRYSSSGGTSCAIVEARSVNIHDCIVEAETNAPLYCFNLNVSGASGADGSSIIMTGNDMSQSTYSSQWYTLDTELGAAITILGNMPKAGMGRHIEQEFRVLGSTGAMVTPWSYTMPSTEVGATVELRAIGQSHPSTGTQDRTVAGKHVATYYKNASSATSVIGSDISYLHKNITTNDAPIRLIRMTGSAWPTTTAVAAGDVYVTGGNVYLVTVAGTTGASAPVHTSGFASTGTETSLFVGAEDVDLLQAVLSGGTATSLYWIGTVSMLQAR